MADAEIQVLRLGHRLPRDERISTHVALVARAFDASSVAYSGQHDSGLEESVARICGNWGGRVQAAGSQSQASGSGPAFSISYEKKFAQFIKNKKREGFAVVHLTMYGIPLVQKAAEIRKRGRVLLVVGSEQVPREVYALADFNVSVTSQPHSEVAALAIALDRLMDGRELLPPEAGGPDFGGKIRIVPSERGKVVVKR